MLKRIDIKGSVSEKPKKSYILTSKIVNISPGTFRLLLALLVVVYHAVAFLSFGHAVVYMFFVLSGYWIFRMYDEKYSKFDKAYLVYLISRFWRLYPIYWLILLITLTCYFLTPSLHDKVIHDAGPNLWATLLSNIVAVTNGFEGYWLLMPAWSLSVELQFYIIMPLLLLLIKNRVTSIVFLALSMVLIPVGIYYGWAVMRLESVLLYLPYFLAGGILYSRNLKASYTSAKLSVFLVIALIVLSHGIPVFRQALLDRHFMVYGFFFQEIFNIIITLAALPFIIYNIHTPVVNREKDSLFSSMSFVVYLIHWPVLQVYALSVAHVGGIQKIIHLGLYFVVCIGISYFISKYIDQWFEKKRRHWLKGKKIKMVA